MTISSTDYALLSQDAYSDRPLNTNFQLGGVTYQAIDHANNPTTGFQATAYERTDTHEVVIAYRGSEFGREPLQDGGTDVGMALAGFNAQAPDAMAFTSKVMTEAKQSADENHTPLNVTVTGHSLGGTLAEMASYKYGLHGETFNAFGAAGLVGVPQGGNQIIDNVRATDVVSAASAHFGEVRVYATQQDVDHLKQEGYRNDSGLLSPRNPIGEVIKDVGPAHAIDNFVPDSKTLGHTIMTPENAAIYQDNKGMIDRYRNDIRDIRTIAAAPGVAVTTTVEGVAHGVEYAGHEIAQGARAVGHAVKEGAQAVEHGVEYVGHEIGKGVHAVEQRIEHVFHKNHASAAPTSLDQSDHPGNAMYEQARSGVQKLDAQQGRASDQHSDNLAASLTVAAQRDGLNQINHVVLSEDASRTYAVQGDMRSPLKQVAQVDTAQAINTPVAQSSATWQQQASQQQANPTQAIQPAQQTPTPQPQQPAPQQPAQARQQ